MDGRGRGKRERKSMTSERRGKTEEEEGGAREAAGATVLLMDTYMLPGA